MSNYNFNIRLVTILVAFCSFFSYTQNKNTSWRNKDSTLIEFTPHPIKKIVFGTETAMFYASNIDTITWKNKRFSIFSWEPHLSYYPINNFGFGITSRIIHFQSNFLPDQFTSYEIGVSTRWFFPVKINYPYLDRFTFSSEFSFSKANYYYDKLGMRFFVDNMAQNLIKIPLITSFRLVNNLNIRISLRYINFIGQFQNAELSFGFEYYILKKKKK
ncbi:MAG TPA: hypothetical protein EYG85_10870 [Crocinitomix sp.]|nr:hypothetical protein [Crocinitomix sp.]